MSNIHTLDLNKNLKPATRPKKRKPKKPKKEGNERFRIRIPGIPDDSRINTKLTRIATTQFTKHPKDENFWDMIKNTACPTFRFLSFTFLVSVLNLGLFICSLVSDGIDYGQLLLEVKLGPLMTFIACSPIKIKLDYELWRFITPVFFHLNLEHIFANTFSIIIWGAAIEDVLGTFRFIVIYIVSGRPKTAQNYQKIFF